MGRKVLFYTHAFGGGGAEIVFARLAAAFAEAGDEVLFAADYAGPVPVRDSPNLRHVLLGADHIGATRRLAGLLASMTPHASFSALGAQNLKHLAAAVAAGRRRQCVLGYHGFAAAEPKRLSRLSYWASPVTTRLAAKTICVSDTLLDDIRHRWHASAARTLRIYNPLPPGGGPTESRARNAPPLVLACGRLVASKRFPDLVKALAQTAPSDARLAILGAGPDRPAIEAAIARLDLAHRVDLPGHVDDPAPWYRRASCLAITSETESFGLTAAEALAHGLPVVTTACGGPPEIIDQGRFGRIVPVGDVAAIADALTRTLREVPDTAALRGRAELFAMTTIHRAYADLIDSLP